MTPAARRHVAPCFGTFASLQVILRSIVAIALVSLLCDVAVASGASLAEASRKWDGEGSRDAVGVGVGNNCRRNISDVESKCLLAPVVFEGTVKSTGHRSDNRWTNANLQVNVVHKGDLEDNLAVNVGFVGGDGNDYDDDKCEFRRDIFEVGKKYVVFATRDLVLDSVATTSAPKHGLIVFSEPVLRTKRSSRIVRKTLCTGCAKPPSISGLKDITVRNNSKVQLKCKAKGNPAPEITWYKDDYPVTETENIVINKTKLTSKLTIKKVGKDNTGQYKCRATSVYGDPAFSKGNLKIRSRPTKRPTTTLGPDQSRPCGGYNEYCLNGGTCFFYETLGEYVCQCAEGYKGRRCESKDIYHLGSMDWTYHINILTVVVILAGFLFCLTIGGIVTYVIHRKKKNEQWEAEVSEVEELFSSRISKRPIASKGGFVESISLKKLNTSDEPMTINGSSQFEVSVQFNGQEAATCDTSQQLDNNENLHNSNGLNSMDGLGAEVASPKSFLHHAGHTHTAVQDLNANYPDNLLYIQRESVEIA